MRKKPCKEAAKHSYSIDCPHDPPICECCPSIVKNIEIKSLKEILQKTKSHAPSYADNPQKKEAGDKLIRSWGKLQALVERNETPPGVALLVFGILTEMANFGTEHLTIKIASDAVKKAANTRQAPRQEILLKVRAFVELSLDGNDNPEWKTADYFNRLRDRDPYDKKIKSGDNSIYVVSDKSLHKEIIKVFKDRKLDDCISNSKAQHVNRNS